MRFEDNYEFLSNFYPVEVSFDGETYASVEHAYQAAKSEHEGDRALIRQTKTAGAAKRLGRKFKLREDWELIKLDVMESLLRQKFGNPMLGLMLDQTYPDELIEENWWGDTYWGVCEGRGDNHLGKLLMKIRSEIQ